jgi:hypothetical protein
VVSKTKQHFLKDGFKKKQLVQLWRKCIEARNDFVEK